MPLYEMTVPEKNIVVIDVGSAYTKYSFQLTLIIVDSWSLFVFCRLGFSGEYSPRCIIPTEVCCKKTGKLRKIFDYEDADDLHDLLVDFLNMLYFRWANKRWWFLHLVRFNIMILQIRIGES